MPDANMTEAAPATHVVTPQRNGDQTIVFTPAPAPPVPAAAPPVPAAAAAPPPVPIAAATTTPRIRIQSHPTQSELVQRFVSVFSPLSTATRFAACEPEEPKKAPEPTWGRWFN